MEIQVTIPQVVMGKTILIDDPQVNRASEAQVAVEWEVGDVILDLYEVKHIFKIGGMGWVYRVHHRNWNMDLAVKSPRADHFSSEAQKENFVRECETWIDLGLHPHIVSCYYVRTLGGIPRIFAEYVEGGSLKEWIDSKKLYEGGQQEALKRILDIAIQTAWGLHYAHEQGVIHQDVNPANVLMMPDGTAKITDFGLAKARGMANEKALDGREKSYVVPIRGMTIEYCSPEQAMKEELTHKTDIWSWAVSVVEMIVGGVNWQSGITAPGVLKHLSEVRVKNVGIPEPPPELLKILEQCFVLETEGRPDNLREVADSLKDIYKRHVGEEYVRELPEAAKIQADALNNRAVSMLDLGRTTEAEKLFEEALRVDPGHPQATYNRGLYLWRNSRVTDDVIVTELEQSQRNRPGDWQVPYLLGLIHLERWDAERALNALSDAQKLKDSDEIKQALAEAKRLETYAIKRLRTFEGHSESVNSVALSADGHFALSESGDETLRLWEVSSGKCLRSFKGHSYVVTSVALSADGRFALSGSYDKTICLWEVSKGKCLRTFKGHSDIVTSVALSADGRFALSGSYDKTICLWEISRGKCLRTFRGHSDIVMSVALSVDGRSALSGSWDKTLCLWEVSRGKCLRTFEGHMDGVTSVALNADGRFALSGSHDKTLRLWEVSRGKCLRTIEGHSDVVTSVALSADGRFALSGSDDKTLRLWEISSGKCLRTFERHMDGVTSVALSADGRFALSMGRTVRLWDIRGIFDRHQHLSFSMVICRLADVKESLGLQKNFFYLQSAAEKALTEGKYACAWNLVAESNALPGYEFSIEALAVANRISLHGRRTMFRVGWHQRTFVEHSESVKKVAMSADGRFALSGGDDETLRLWEVGSGKCLRTFDAHSDWVRSVALSADGRFALSVGDDETLRFWEVRSGKCLRIIEGHLRSVLSVALSADCCFALSGSRNGTLRFWEVRSGKCLRIFEGHMYKVGSVALSADCCFALSGSHNGTLRFWEVRSGKCLRTFKGHSDIVMSVALSADGRFALSGSNDKTLRLWEVSSGKCLRIFEGHSESVTSVALSADGRFALSGSNDKTLRLWEVSSGKCLRIFEGHSNAVTSVALSADGRFALSGSKDRTLRLWQLEWDYEFPEPKDWDEGARPYLEIFLTLHCALGRDGITRVGRPIWTEEDFQKMLVDLQYRGYGWLRPEGVRRQLMKMASELVWK